MTGWPGRLKSQDLWAGLAFVLVGVAALVLGRGLTFGTADDMGEGYVPRAMAIALVALGLLVAGMGLRRGSEPVDSMRLRPLLFVTASVLAFIASLQALGVVMAITASTVCASFAGEPLRPRALAAVIIVLSLVVIGVFVKGLGLPLAILPRVGG